MNRKVKSIGYIMLLILSVAACEKKEKETPSSVTPPDYIMAGQDTGSSILYFDLNPNDTFYFDHPGSGYSRKVDLDQDSVYDFEVGYGNSVSPGHTSVYSNVKILNGAGVLTDSAHSTWALPLVAGDTIDFRGTWNDSTSILYSYFSSISNPGTSSGLWKNQLDVYLGVRLYKANDTLYGWISVGMEGSYRLIIRDWAVRK